LAEKVATLGSGIGYDIEREQAIGMVGWQGAGERIFTSMSLNFEGITKDQYGKPFPREMTFTFHSVIRFRMLLRWWTKADR
jgi:hypothetical protein